MGENWTTNFEEELSCPICLDLFTEATSLQCGHTFCRQCITKELKRKMWCPICKDAYTVFPELRINNKLANFLQRFKSLTEGKSLAVTPVHCVLCLDKAQAPLKKFCLRCNAACCQTHIETHLQQPSPKRLQHLLVDMEEVQSWVCQWHKELRLYYCTRRRMAVCHKCCSPNESCRHVDVVRYQQRITKKLKKMLMRIRDGELSIKEQQLKVESHKQHMETEAKQLKQNICMHYQMLHQLLNKDLKIKLDALEMDYAKFCQENCSQHFKLKEQQQEAHRLVTALQHSLDHSDNITFITNTSPVKTLVDKSRAFKVIELAAYKAGHLNTGTFISGAAKKENYIRKILEKPFTVPEYESGRPVKKQESVQKRFRGLRRNFKIFHNNKTLASIQGAIRKALVF